MEEEPQDQPQEPAKEKGDIELPFISIKEKGKHVKVGPIEVKGEGEDVKVGPLHFSEGKVKTERTINSRLEGLAWALFLILIGSVFLFENMYGMNLDGVIPIGIGAIWLGLNFARSQLHIPTSTFTIVLGVLAIVYGLTEMFVVHVDFIAVAAIVVGVLIILKYVKR
ncbi:MAG: hypothetical protein PVF58_02490 [Candidatus Methanofastidiosia archaeon]